MTFRPRFRSLRHLGVIRAAALFLVACADTSDQTGVPSSPIASIEQAVTSPCTKDLQGVGQLASGWYGIRTDGTLWRPINPLKPGEASQRDNTLGNDNVALADMDGEANHECALKANGDVYCWGSNAHGELGRGFTSVQEEPARVSGLPTKAKQVAVSADDSCALLIDGAVWCWGSNAEGQLGNGTSGITDQVTPAQVIAIGTGNDAITSGYRHTCALKAGAVSCWGYNDTYGAVGNGTWVPVVATPALVQTGVLQVSAGGYETCSIRNDHSLWCWGDNFWGELGLGDGVNRNAPTQVMSVGTTAQFVDAGEHSACGIVTGGLVRCWGSPENGRLGNGQLGTSPPVAAECQRVPTAVMGPLGATGGASYLRVGKASGCAVMTTGQVFCWGAGGFIDGAPQTSSPVEIDFCGLPTLDTITPASAAAAGSTPVTLKGTEWKPGATVTFGMAMQGTMTMVPDPTTVTTIAPAGPMGAVDVTVTNPDGHYAKLTKGFSFGPPPTLMSISPDTGPEVGGTSVTVKGTGFDFNTSVSFGGVVSLSVVAMDSMTLVASTPRHPPGVVDVVVTRADGTSAMLPQSFTYTPGGGTSSASSGTGGAPYDGPGNGCYCATTNDPRGSMPAVSICGLGTLLALRLSRRRRSAK